MTRQAEHEDSDAILKLAKEFATSFVIDEEVFRASFIALLADPSSYFAVAEWDESVVGYALAFSHPTFYANGSVAWVEELMVDADYRNQGIGKALMQSVEEWAKSQGCQLTALATRRAAGFYEALEYQASATYFRKLI